MRESIGATSIFALCLTFIMLFTAYLAISVNYAKAFRIKNQVITMIEENNGKAKSIEKDISDYLVSEAYTATKQCPSPRTYTDNATGSISSGWNRIIALNYMNDASPKKNICVYRMEIDNRNDDIDSTTVYYKVVTFFKFDLPMVGDITTFSVSGDTKLIYED